MKTLQLLSAGLFTFAVVWVAGHEPAVRRVATNIFVSGGPQLAAVALAPEPAVGTIESTAEVKPACVNCVSESPAFAPLTAKFAIGDRGSHVKQLQEMLAALGIYTGVITGEYDAGTVAAVTELQNNYHLPVTPETAGLAGPTTRAKLNELLVKAPVAAPSSASAALSPVVTPASPEVAAALRPLLEPLLTLLSSGF